MQATITPETIALIEEWTETEADGIQPIHDVTDPEHLETIKDSLRENGWQGAPLVVAGMQAITGAHRYWAVEALRGEGAEIEIPRIEVSELCDLFDADWAALEDEYGLNNGMDWYEAARHLDEVLPADVIAYLGIDIH